jgi:DNA gyrase/topoisomerase IV subunit B
VNGKEINNDWVFHPQSSWVFDPFKIIIYENLQEEINKLNEDLSVNIQLEVRNKSEKIDFEYSGDNIDYLKLIYRKDFQLYEKYSLKTRIH